MRFKIELSFITDYLNILNEINKNKIFVLLYFTLLSIYN
jgi:hypothetical protein